MAINKLPDTISGYWLRYWRRIVFFVITMQVIAVLVIVAALMYFGIIEPYDYRFWVVALAMLVGVIGMNIVILPVVVEPLKQIVAALAHANGERSSVAPPNPNTTRYRTNGIQPILQSIYEFGAKTEKATEPQALSVTPNQTELPEDLETVFGQSPAGVIVFSDAKTVKYHNQAAPIGVNDDGGYWLDLLFYTDTPFEEWVKECEKKEIRASKTWRHIANRPPGDEDRRVFDIVASYQKGSNAPIVLLLIDRTKDYAPEDEGLNFISFAAHELRGPITVIRGYLDTIVDEMHDSFTNDQRELFERLIVSANRLSTYINNILNTAKYDRSNLSVHLTQSTIHNVYAIVADDMELRARSQQRLLSVNLPKELPPIAADPASLSEVFANLIDNAIKYSNEGGAVEVSAELHDSMVEVSITDHGIGMPANVVSNLFHKFYRSHRSRETVAGTGIGLYISKAITESHGGTLMARSVEGMGSTFTFSIPTYASVADKLQQSGGDSQSIIHNTGGGWIKNHGVIKG